MFCVINKTENSAGHLSEEGGGDAFSVQDRGSEFGETIKRRCFVKRTSTRSYETREEEGVGLIR